MLLSASLSRTPKNPASPAVQWLFNSPLGALFAMASEKGLEVLSFQRQPGVSQASSLNQSGAPFEILQETCQQLTEYFEGQRQTFDLPLAPQGTDFQREVWQELLNIPFGQTLSYGELAERVGKPKAARAVGSANGKNPLCLVIPCHRVIAADGGLGGYAYGLSIKEQLLAHEGLSF